MNDLVGSVIHKVLSSGMSLNTTTGLSKAVIFTLYSRFLVQMPFLNTADPFLAVSKSKGKPKH